MPQDVPFSASVTETATGGDSYSASVTFSATTAEVAVALDAPSAAVGLSVAVAEAALADDSPSVGVVYECGVSEAATATDDVRASAVFTSYVTEAADATDLTTSDPEPSPTRVGPVFGLPIKKRKNSTKLADPKVIARLLAELRRRRVDEAVALLAMEGML